MPFLASTLPALTNTVSQFESDALWLSPVLIAASISVLLIVTAWSLLQTFNHNPPAHFLRIWGQLFLLYLAPTMPWWGGLIVTLLATGTLSIIVGIFLLIIIALYFYSVRIVPHQLAVHTIDDKPALSTLKNNSNVAVVSNIRLGLFSHPSHLIKLVEHLNALDVDSVIILGEWLYNPPADLVGNLMQLKVINKPVYAIQGAYDNRYHPDNADQFLHEDDLTHAFASLGIEEVSGAVTTHSNINLFGQPQRAQTKQSKPQTADLVLCNTKRDLAQYLSQHSDISTSSELKTLILAPSDSKIFKAKTAIELPQNTAIKKLPSFGKRGLPFRLSKPCITVLHLNVK